MRRTTLVLTVAAMGLSACSDAPWLAGFYQPAGAFLDEGRFGNPTMNNTQVHNGELSAVASLNERFSREVNPMVTFAFDSAELDATARAILDRQAHWIKQFPEVRFRVYGHTDLVGSDAYNRRLGKRRAKAVVRYLTHRHGISRNRLEALVSYGETQPLIFTQHPERKNRRTVTEVSGFLGRKPTALNGKYAEVIFREYVESATEIPPEQAGADGGVVQSGGGAP